MAARTTLIALLLAAGCATRLLQPGDVLSYAQYESLEKGMLAKTVLELFGEPLHRLEKDGAVRGLTYRCENARGEVVELRLGFGADGVLRKWTLAGEGA